MWFYRCSFIFNCLKMPEKSQINERSDRSLKKFHMQYGRRYMQSICKLILTTPCRKKHARSGLGSALTNRDWKVASRWRIECLLAEQWGVGTIKANQIHQIFQHSVPRSCNWTTQRPNCLNHTQQYRRTSIYAINVVQHNNILSSNEIWWWNVV